MLNVFLGQNVIFTIEGHSALNGALIPEGAKVEVTSNAPEVATPAVAIVGVPTGGAQSIPVPINVVGKGAVDIHVKVSPIDGSGPFEATDSMIVMDKPQPGLVAVTGTLSIVE